MLYIHNQSFLESMNIYLYIIFSSLFSENFSYTIYGNKPSISRPALSLHVTSSCSISYNDSSSFQIKIKMPNLASRKQ